MKKQYAVNVENSSIYHFNCCFLRKYFVSPAITSLAELHRHTATREIGIRKAPGVVAEC